MKEKLPFPTRPLDTRNGTVEEYIIPEDKKAEVLERLYIFRPIPQLDDEKFDLHEGRSFRVGDFRVIWENERNFVVSPYFLTSGGTIIDWMPV